MPAEAVRIREIVSFEDPAWPSWRTLYQTAFPPYERMSERYFLDVFARKARGEASDEHMLALQIGDAADCAGLAYYALPRTPKLGFLWYLAVDPARQGQGLGTALYGEFCARVRDAGARMAVYEVETPECASNAEAACLARRRVDWYRRLGANVLANVHYLQEVDNGEPPLPMTLMVHPFGPLDAEDACALAQAQFGDALTRLGPPALV